MKHLYCETLRILKGYIFLFLSIICCLAGFSSCDNDDWGPFEPSSFDSRLNGYWQLVQENGAQVSGFDINYMFFNGTGEGVYFYYLDEDKYMEKLDYECHIAANGAYRDQLTIHYANAVAPATVSYWFENGARTLYMQWEENGRNVTYTYTKYPSAPW